MLKKAYNAKGLAQLLGISQQAIGKKAKAERWEKHPRTGRGGGFQFPLCEMPQETQLAIRIAEERQILAQQEESNSALLNASAAFEQSTTILDDNRRNKACVKGDIVRLYLGWQRKHGKTIAQKDAFISAYLGGAWPNLLVAYGDKISWKSIERWKNQQIEAGTVLALADKRGIAHKGRSSLTEQHRIIILGQILNPNAPSISECVRRIEKRCIAENLYVPSEPTIRRFVRAYASECFDEWTLWREGQKAWNDKCAISILRDWNLVEVGDVVIADGHTLNFETLDPDTGKAKRMTLLLFYDGASSHPLGWEIMPTENTACISAAFRRTCLILGKFPRVVYLDNGKAFRAKYFKGTSDFEQAGFLGLYRDLGCEVIHAWPYHGQSKPIERFFGTFHQMEMFVPSYVGNSIANQPARMKRGEDLHRQLYKTMGGRPLTLEETHTAIASWFCEYANRPQYRTHLQGRTPGQVFTEGRGPGIDADRLILLMLQKEIKTIYKDGIRHLGRLYWHEALSSRRHSVLIRYDEQLSPYTVFVYTTDGNFICEARDRAHYKIASGLHPAARVLGSAEQVQDLSDAIDLKRGQEKLAGANLRQMLNAVVLPEVQKAQAALMQPALPSKAAPLPRPAKNKPITAEQVAQIEEAKEKSRVIFDTNSSVYSEYTPSALKRFKDELERYEYLFALFYEQGVELVTQDKVWMQNFEESQQYQRNYKRRYDARLALLSFRQQVS